MRHQKTKNRFQDQLAELAPLSLILVLISIVPSCPAQSTRHRPASRTLLDHLPEQSNPKGVPPSAPANPATVLLKGGKLTVNANNSELRQVLEDVSRASGMAIQGQVRDTRIFGNYGPGEPPAVLTELLAGQGYNILMVGGGQEGAPRQLLLTDRSNSPLPTPPAANQDKAERVELGPGAIAHPPPEAVEDPQMRTYLRDRKLQQMYESQEKENKGNSAPTK